MLEITAPDCKSWNTFEDRSVRAMMVSCKDWGHAKDLYSVAKIYLTLRFDERMRDSDVGNPKWKVQSPCLYKAGDIVYVRGACS